MNSFKTAIREYLDPRNISAIRCVVCAHAVNNNQQVHKESTTLGAKDVEELYTAGPNSLNIVVGSKSVVLLQQPQLLCSVFIRLIMRTIIFLQAYVFVIDLWLSSSSHSTPTVSTTPSGLVSSARAHTSSLLVATCVILHTETWSR